MGGQAGSDAALSDCGGGGTVPGTAGVGADCAGDGESGRDFCSRPVESVHNLSMDSTSPWPEFKGLGLLGSRTAAHDGAWRRCLAILLPAAGRDASANSHQFACYISQLSPVRGRLHTGDSML